jgi:AraC-like DNA-binding protein
MTISNFTWYCGTDLPGEVMAAALEAYHFEPHFHDAWSVGAIAAGSCVFSCRGATHVARQGDLVVIPPRVVHTGGTSEGQLCYGMAYIQTSWFDAHAAMLGEGGVQFADVVISDRSLCDRWLAALTSDALADSARKNDISAALLELLLQHGLPGDGSMRATPAAKTPRNVCEELQASMMHGDPGKADVETLAKRCGVHRTTLVKQFSRHYGLPPDAWLRNWRAAKAKALMMNGMSLADAAAATGFADQAHLTRVFKRIHGTPPGALRKSVLREGGE